MNNICNPCKIKLIRDLPKEIQDLLNTIEYEKKDRQWLLDNIVKYIQNNYPLDVLVKNYKDIRKIGKNSASKDSFICRYGEEIGSRLCEEFTKNRTVDKNHMIQKLGEEGAKEFYYKRASKLEVYIQRYGEIEGKQKWDIYKQKRANSYRKKRENGHIYPKYNLDYFIFLYGEEKGTEVYEAKMKKSSYKSSRQYYIDRFGEELGTEICKKTKDNLSLRFFQEKYGEETGKILYEESKEKRKGTYRSTSFSQLSKELFDMIKYEVVDLEYYAEKEKAIVVDRAINLNKANVIFPDLVYKNKIIEFNGDLFHANPIKFNKDDTPHPFRPELLAEEIWESDKNRKLYLESISYEVMIVWEHDYRMNKKHVIEECIKFLTKDGN